MVQGVPGRQPDLDTSLSRKPDDLADLPVQFSLFGNEQPLDRPPCPESFQDGIDAGYFIFIHMSL